jgi:hypothetical protein
MEGRKNTKKEKFRENFRENINIFRPMTTDSDLFKIAKKEKIKLDAVVFKDHLKNLQYATDIIVNLQSSNHNGTHWTALHIEPTFAFYSDSFGVVPPVEVIELCRDRKINTLLYNKVQYQHIDEGFCGEFSLSFLGLLQSKLK